MPRALWLGAKNTPTREQQKHNPRQEPICARTCHLSPQNTAQQTQTTLPAKYILLKHMWMYHTHTHTHFLELAISMIRANVKKQPFSPCLSKSLIKREVFDAACISSTCHIYLLALHTSMYVCMCEMRSKTPGVVATWDVMVFNVTIIPQHAAGSVWITAVPFFCCLLVNLSDGVGQVIQNHAVNLAAVSYFIVLVLIP